MACLSTCAYKMEAAEKIAISAVKNHSFYNSKITSYNNRILEEDKKIENLIEKLY